MGGMCRCTERLDGKTVLVTGANTGIGKETAANLAKRGARVILACRDLRKAEEAAKEMREMEGVQADNVVVMKLDLSDMSSVKAFADAFKSKESHLHILINNAGVAYVDYSRTKDGLETHMGVNHFGHFLLTHLLLAKLEACAPSRIINVSSLAHKFRGFDLDDLHFERRPYSSVKAYAQSKVANILFTQQLAARLKDKNITVNSLHPGAVNTDVLRYTRFGRQGSLLQKMSDPFLSLVLKTPVQGAQTTIHLAVSTELAGVTGSYFANCKQQRTSNSSIITADAADKLWLLSLETCKPFLAHS